ncbi:ZZ-type domain-containing protein [Mycena venus]|uniref:ZZ-type domain-containing protein n=1 Tax=Mycena venus TaxID=2733690 RepID=A0A8H6Z1V0_9AGAR|nr:ZZ-type domain-containing protein [Mycena venus]
MGRINGIGYIHPNKSHRALRIPSMIRLHSIQIICSPTLNLQRYHCLTALSRSVNFLASNSHPTLPRSMPVVSSLKPSPAAQSAAQTSSPVIQYLCDGCSQPISHASPRVHCLACPDHDLCANCALGERFGGEHTAEHPTAVYRVSGDSAVTPVRSQASLTYNSIPTASVTHTMGASTLHASQSTSPGGTSAEESIHVGVAMHGTPTTLAVGTSTGGSTSSVPSSTEPPDGWSPFFYADMNSTPTFTALMNAIFGHLDTARTGLLPPEGYSRLLDDMGFSVQENIWKSNLGNPMVAQNRESTADTALKYALDMLGIEHILQQRSGPPNLHPGIGTAPMPLITPRGLADLIAIELLTDPAAAWQKLARVVQLYGLYNVEPYRRWGALPRSVLPSAPDARMVARVAAMGAQVQGVDVAKMSAQIQATANLAAVNAVGGTQYSYRYI